MRGHLGVDSWYALRVAYLEGSASSDAGVRQAEIVAKETARNSHMRISSNQTKYNM